MFRTIQNFETLDDWLRSLTTKSVANVWENLSKNISVNDLISLSKEALAVLEKILETMPKGDDRKHILELARQASSSSVRIKALCTWFRFREGGIGASAPEFQESFSPFVTCDLSKLNKIIHQAFLEKDFELAYRYLLQASFFATEFNDVKRFSGWVRRLTEQSSSIKERLTPLRVAILGGLTTTYLNSVLPVYAFLKGLRLETYEAEYNSIDLEVHDQQSRLYEFKPDVVLLLPIQEHLPLSSDDCVDTEAKHWQDLWNILTQKLESKVVQLLFEEDLEEDNLLLNLSNVSSRRSKLRSLNNKLINQKSPSVMLIDYQGIISLYGKKNWVNRKYWHLAKQPVSMNFIPTLARHIVATIGINMGSSKRCLAVDLDNTLWGGVLGEEDIYGVKCGQGDAESESYLDFQRYLKNLADQGCILTLVSKNDELIVKECFEKRKEDFALAWSDFASARVNWVDKAENIKSLSDELSLPLEHFVFVDDNPTERARVRQVLPAVTVPELSTDASSYRSSIESLVLFERQHVTEEDLLRKATYQTNREREKLKASAPSLGEFLSSLEMELVAKEIDESVIDRAYQLVSKTNQFNLTTKRYSPAQLQEMAKDPTNRLILYRLRDRFGDYGWISLLVLKSNGEELDIDSWLMSCRVLGKSVENCMVEDVMSTARDMDCKRVRGTYVPTKKNGLVSQLFPKMGFKLKQEGPPASTFIFHCSEKTELPKYYIKRRDLGRLQ